MQRILYFMTVLMMATITSIGQKANDETGSFSVTVVNEKQQSLQGVTIEVFSIKDSGLIKAAITDSTGTAVFDEVLPGEFFLKASHSGYTTQSNRLNTSPDQPGNANHTIILKPTVATMQGVTVIGTRPFVQHVQGKVLINVDAAITNSGTTVLEVLEKSPGVMVDKNGTISLQAKTGVLVMIDGKPTYLSGAMICRNYFIQPASYLLG